MQAGKLKPAERKEWRAEKGKHKWPMRVGTYDNSPYGSTKAILMRGGRGGFYLKKADGRKHKRYLPIKLVGQHGFFDEGKEPGGVLAERIQKWQASVKRKDKKSVWKEISLIRKGKKAEDREDEKEAVVDDYRSKLIKEASERGKVKAPTRKEKKTEKKTGAGVRSNSGRTD